MGHQFSPHPTQQYQNQANFLSTAVTTTTTNNNNNNNDSNNASGASRRSYFDPNQSGPPLRVVYRRPQFYHHHQQQQQQQPNPGAYQAPLLHAPPVIESHRSASYEGDLYAQPHDEFYNHQKFIATSQPFSYRQDELASNYDAFHEPQHRVYDEPVYLQQNPGGQPLTYQGHDYIEQPLEGYLDGGLYMQVSQPPPPPPPPPSSHCERATVMSPATARQHVAPRMIGQRTQQNFLQAEVMLPPRRRMPAPSQHHYQNHHHHHHHHHLQQQQEHYHQHINQQQQQQNSAELAGNYFRYGPPQQGARATGGLSDGQQVQYQLSLARPQPSVQLQSVLVPNPSRPTSQMYYAQTNANQYDAAALSSLLSSSSGGADIIPSQNQQDLMLNNGSMTASTLYDSASEADGGGPLQTAPSASDVGVPFGSQSSFVAQRTTPSSSSSMLLEPNVIRAPPSVSRDLPGATDGTAPPNAAMLDRSSTKATIARPHVANIRASNSVQYVQDSNGFKGVYECDSSSNNNSVTTTAQQALGSQQAMAASFSSYDGGDDSLSASPIASRGVGGGQQDDLDSTSKQQPIVRSPSSDTRLGAIPSLNPKSNPAEYLDMGTSTEVSQDWLDTICGHLIEHMDDFGICVIDNFLGSPKGELILEEVHRLYSNGRHSKGRLMSDKLSAEGEGGGAKNSTGKMLAPSADNGLSTAAVKNNASGNSDGSVMASGEQAPVQRQQQPQSQHRLQGTAADATGRIRSDRVIWVDGCEDGCSEINNLIQTLCSVITNSSRLSLYSNNGLDKVNINKRTKAHVACYPGNGTRYIKHVDNPNGDGRAITAIYYLNKNWSTKRDGGLLRMFPAGMDEVANIEPLFDRALFFWSDRRNPHEVLPSFRDRFAITVWYIGESRP